MSLGRTMQCYSVRGTKEFPLIYSGGNTEKCFLFGQRIISTAIVLYKDDVLVGLIIPSESDRIELDRVIESFSQ